MIRTTSPYLTTQETLDHLEHITGTRFQHLLTPAQAEVLTTYYRYKPDTPAIAHYLRLTLTKFPTPEHIEQLVEETPEVVMRHLTGYYELPLGAQENTKYVIDLLAQAAPLPTWFYFHHRYGCDSGTFTYVLQVLHATGYTHLLKNPDSVPALLRLYEEQTPPTTVSTLQADRGYWWLIALLTLGEGEAEQVWEWFTQLDYPHHDLVTLLHILAPPNGLGVTQDEWLGIPLMIRLNMVENMLNE